MNTSIIRSLLPTGRQAEVGVLLSHLFIMFTPFFRGKNKMLTLLRNLFLLPMIYEKVNEPVEVLAAFRGNRTEPMTFKWGKKYYQVHKVNLVHTEHDGREKVYYFSVSDETTSFRLSFRTESLKWNLEEVCEVT